MLTNAKALVVVLALALVTFHVCKPIAVQFMREETFARRRNVWIALTVVAFLSPSFWIWAFVAAFVVSIAVRKDDNPASLFALLLFVVPQVNIFIPVVGINQLFAMTPLRLLGLLILIPTWFVYRRHRHGARTNPLADLAMAGFILLQIVLLIPYETVTTTMRRSFLFFVDIGMVWLVFSRVPNRNYLLDIMASFFIGHAVMAPMAVFESLRGWQMYVGLTSTWGDPNAFAYLMRGDELRAQVATGHSIGLGYEMALAIGMYLALRNFCVVRKALDAMVLILLGAATIVSYSRGGWLTAVVILVIFAILRPDARKHAAKFFGVAVAIVAAALVSPLRDKVFQRLPFVGTADQDTVGYRQQLSDIGWSVVMQNPWFGDPFATQRLGMLRQGQGIIDLVNGYLYVALFNGLIGLALLGLVFGSSLLPALRATLARGADSASRTLSAALSACFVASLAFVATAGVTTTMYMVCALLISCVAVVRSASAMPNDEQRSSSRLGSFRPLLR